MISYNKQSLENTFKLVFGTIFLLISTSSAILAQKTDFSGNWKRNTEKTNTGGLSINSVAVTIKVSQDNQKISIERISKNRQGEVFSYTETLEFSGTQAESKPKSNLKKKSSIKWSADQQQLIEKAEFFDDPGNLVQKSVDTWSLIDDGKSLKLSSVIELDGKTANFTAIFDKEQ